jgi:sulfite reductase beta subunit-like hemoprotein
MNETKEITKAEQIKIDSNGLRGTILDEIRSEGIKKFTHANENLLKFHGIYQQKDRDRRAKDQKHLGPKPFVLMVRGRIAGGRLNAKQWLAWDKVADLYGSDGLRLTSRQSLQLHGVTRENIQSVTQEIAKELSTTTGACGDVVRNVMVAPNPTGDSQLAAIAEPAQLLSQHFEVQSSAFFEIFVDGKISHSTGVDEPIYGKQFLPRKFKIGVTVEGNNAIDLFTQDLSLVATFTGERIEGYHVFVGGGMGMSHTDSSTFARLADHLGWIPAIGLVPVAEAIVKTQRDYGDRQNRSHARLKYTIADRGLSWFRQEVETRSNIILEDRHFQDWVTPSSLGWNKHRNGSWSLGIHLLSGRIKDDENRKTKTTIKFLVHRYNLEVQLTSEQDLILYGIPETARIDVESYLLKQGFDPRSPSKLFDRAMTCVALPMCSKALAEGERMGPEFFRVINHLLIKHGLSHKAPTVRVTGCPNGCARPYAAEIGLVGQMPNKYALYLGGSAEGTRLATKFMDKLALDDIPEILDQLFLQWKQSEQEAIGFGDFIYYTKTNSTLTNLAEEEGQRL